MPTTHRALGFLDLPGEIREKIYQFLFESAQIEVKSNALFDRPRCRSVVCSGGFQWNLLSTCRSIHNEATPYLLASTTLQISQPLDDTTAIPQHYLDHIQRLVVSDIKSFSRESFRPERLPALRVLELRGVMIWCNNHSGDYLMKNESGDSTMFGLAMHNLTQISANLLDLVAPDKGRKYVIRLFSQFVVSVDRFDAVVSFPQFFYVSIYTRPARRC